MECISMCICHGVYKHVCMPWNTENASILLSSSQVFLYEHSYFTEYWEKVKNHPIYCTTTTTCLQIYDNNRSMTIAGFTLHVIKFDA